MELAEYDTSKRVQCSLKESLRITGDGSSEEVRELRLQVSQDNNGFVAGQLIGVLVPGPHPMGNQYHFRLYTIADLVEQKATKQSELSIVVRRCNYIDEYSGEEYSGIASNYLCDLEPGKQVLITGPFGIPFQQPEEKDANIIMIGMGTGIAPFRAFVKKLYQDKERHDYSVRLFYGAHTGLEMLYMNDHNNDLANYFDENTFKAIQALSTRPDWQRTGALEEALQLHQEEVWQMLNSHKTYVYIAGVEEINKQLNKAFSKMAGSREKWQRRKAELVAGERWVELIY